MKRLKFAIVLAIPSIILAVVVILAISLLTTDVAIDYANVHDASFTSLSNNYKCSFEILGQYDDTTYFGHLFLVDTLPSDVLTRPIDSWVKTEFGKKVGIVSLDELYIKMQIADDYSKTRFKEEALLFTDILDRFIFCPETDSIYYIGKKYNDKYTIIGGNLAESDLGYVYLDTTLDFAQDVNITVLNDILSLPEYSAFLTNNSFKLNNKGYITLDENNKITNFEVILSR